MSWDWTARHRATDGVAAHTRHRVALSQRIVERIAGRTGPDRRGFLRGSALVGAAVASAPVAYLLRPQSAYASVCGPDASCAAGYTVFCCTINAGKNACPPNSFIGGWWKADHSSFCGGAARYYIDCNAFRNNSPWRCHCNTDPGTCDHRRVACNQFRYGQCSTQIPLSNTGPVVCRIVSCTPPWKQFAGTCGTTSFTDNRTAEHSAACVSGHAPMGNVNDAGLTGVKVRLRGWAMDQDAPNTSLRVAVSDDTGQLGVFTTTLLRTDVNTRFHVTGNHGFDVTVTPRSGRRTFTVAALDAGGGGNTVIGTRTITVPSDAVPDGNVEVLEAVGNQVRFRGWALDRDHPATSVTVHLHADGRLLTSVPADQPRPDVNAHFGVTGNHGFDTTLTMPTGSHRMDVFALNAGPGTQYAILVAGMLLDVNIGALPRGALDTVTADGERIVLSGWAFDPDDPTAQIDVAVTVDRAVVGTFRADRPRPDVDRVERITGNHGFQASIGAAPGSHDVVVYALNVAGGAANPIIGHTAVRVGDPGGLGSLDDAVVAGTTLHLRGWALDTGQGSAQIAVGVCVDGAPPQSHPTGVPRPDVNARFHVTGNHGFDFSISLSRGRHTVSVFALAARGDALIHQQDVTI